MTPSRLLPSLFTRIERRIPSLWKPAFSATRCDAMLSGSVTSSTRPRPSSSIAHLLSARRAAVVSPRPRASADSQ